MAKFVIILKDKRKGTLTIDLLKKHVEHIRNLTHKGVLFLYGPFTDNDGALLIFETKSYEEAEEYLLHDPFIVQKYYSNYNLYELIEESADDDLDAQTKSNLKFSEKL